MKIDEWIEEATGGIVLAKDRRLTARELSDHFSDHRDALLESGMSDAEAEEEALAALGDPKETRQLLRAACQPVLSLLIKAANVLLLLTALFLFGMLVELQPSEWDRFSMAYWKEPSVADTFSALSQSDDMVRACVSDTAAAGAFHFTVVDAAFNRNIDRSDTSLVAILLVKATAPFYLYAPDILENHLEADDSNGLHYINYEQHSYQDILDQVPMLSCRFYAKRSGCWYYQVRLYLPDQRSMPAPGWIDVSYHYEEIDFNLHLRFEEGLS